MAYTLFVLNPVKGWLCPILKPPVEFAKTASQHLNCYFFKLVVQVLVYFSGTANRSARKGVDE
jgi:hypothetical protein